MTPGQMIENYLKLRRLIHDTETGHKKELAPLIDLRTQLEGALLSYLNEQELESTRCDAGTAFKQTATSVTVKDWRKALGYIREHQLWDMLEARVSKTAVMDMLSEKEELLPGVDVSQVSVLRVRQN
jgi:hypothetical protein